MSRPFPRTTAGLKAREHSGSGLATRNCRCGRAGENSPFQLFLNGAHHPSSLLATSARAQTSDQATCGFARPAVRTVQGSHAESKTAGSPIRWLEVLQAYTFLKVNQIRLGLSLQGLWKQDPGCVETLNPSLSRLSTGSSCFVKSEGPPWTTAAACGGMALRREWREARVLWPFVLRVFRSLKRSAFGYA